MTLTCQACGQQMNIPDHLVGHQLTCRKCKTPFIVPDSRPCPHCAEEIKVAAKICRHCGREVEPERQVGPKPTKRTSPLAVLGLLVVAVVAIWYVVVRGTSTTTPEGRFVMPNVPAQRPPVVTKAEYDLLSEGMSYREAVAVIGAPGEEISRSDLAGFTTIMYSWMNPNGSNMNAMFQNDKLVQKAQFGLP